MRPATALVLALLLVPALTLADDAPADTDQADPAPATTSPEPDPSPAPAPVAAPAPVPDTVASKIRALPEKGGKGAWDTAVRYILLRAYDANANNKLNNPKEVAALTCDDWKAIDDGVRESWDHGLRTIYGFAPGYIWVGKAIGFTRPMRRKADAALVGCGLE